MVWHSHLGLSSRLSERVQSPSNPNLNVAPRPSVAATTSVHSRMGFDNLSLPSFTIFYLWTYGIQNAFNTMNIFQTISARLASAEACWHTIARLCKFAATLVGFPNVIPSCRPASLLPPRAGGIGLEPSPRSQDSHASLISPWPLHVLQIFRNAYKLVDELFGAFLSFHPTEGIPSTSGLSGLFGSTPLKPDSSIGIFTGKQATSIAPECR